MAYVPANDDPFSGGEKIPSLSWRNLPHGSTFTLQIIGSPLRNCSRVTLTRASPTTGTMNARSRSGVRWSMSW